LNQSSNELEVVNVHPDFSSDIDREDVIQEISQTLYPVLQKYEAQQ